MDANSTYRMRAYKAHVEQIPREKWAAKVRRFLVALILLAGVVGAVVAKLEVPWQVLACGLVLAGYFISPDVMAAAIKWLLGAVKDALAVAKNGNGKATG